MYRKWNWLKTKNDGGKINNKDSLVLSWGQDSLETGLFGGTGCRKFNIATGWNAHVVPLDSTFSAGCWKLFNTQPHKVLETTQVRNKFSSLTALNSHASQMLSKMFLHLIALQGLCGETETWANTTDHPARSARQSHSAAWPGKEALRQLHFWKQKYTKLFSKIHCSREIITGTLLQISPALGMEEEKGFKLCW